MNGFYFLTFLSMMAFANLGLASEPRWFPAPSSEEFTAEAATSSMAFGAAMLDADSRERSFDGSSYDVNTLPSPGQALESGGIPSGGGIGGFNTTDTSLGGSPPSSSHPGYRSEPSYYQKTNQSSVCEDLGWVFGMDKSLRGSRGASLEIIFTKVQKGRPYLDDIHCALESGQQGSAKELLKEIVNEDIEALMEMSDKDDYEKVLEWELNSLQAVVGRIEEYSRPQTHVNDLQITESESEFASMKKEEMILVRDGSDTHLIILEASKSCTKQQISEFVERHKTRYLREKQRSLNGANSCGIRKDQLSGLTDMVSETLMAPGRAQLGTCLVNLQILSNELSAQLLNEPLKTKKVAQSQKGPQKTQVSKAPHAETTPYGKGSGQPVSKKSGKKKRAPVRKTFFSR